MTKRSLPCFLALIPMFVVACQPGADDGPDAPGDGDTATLPASGAVAQRGMDGPQETAAEGAGAPASAGKPSAPITIDYTVIGTPVVGQPVSVSLQVSSTLPDRPVTLNYRINDPGNLAFPEAQPERVSLGAINPMQPIHEQVRVVPRKEGRLYLNVAAEVETEDGALMKSLAIPIQVGRTAGGRQGGGELLRNEEGEAVISLPADDQ